jgi:hypothetical protein
VAIRLGILRRWGSLRLGTRRGRPRGWARSPAELARKHQRGRGVLRSLEDAPTEARSSYRPMSSAQPGQLSAVGGAGTWPNCPATCTASPRWRRARRGAAPGRGRRRAVRRLRCRDRWPSLPAVAGAFVHTQSEVPVRSGVGWPHGRHDRPGRSGPSIARRGLASGRDALRRGSWGGGRDGDDGHARAHDRAWACGTDSATGRRPPARAAPGRCCGARRASNVEV